MADCCGRLRGDEEAVACYQRAIALREALGDGIAAYRSGFNLCRYVTLRIKEGRVHLKADWRRLTDEWLSKFQAANWLIGIEAIQKLKAELET